MGNIFEDMNDGFYSDDEYITEATEVSKVPYLRTIKRQVFLPTGNPTGKGCLCYMYTHSFDETLNLIKNRDNLKDKGKYKLYYYNYLYIGKLGVRNYRINTREERKVNYDRIKKEIPGFRVKLKFGDQGGIGNLNTYVDLFTYINIFENICGKFQPSKYVTEFWKFFIANTGLYQFGGYNNSFVLVDLSKYPIQKKLKDNLKNPLYLIYYSALKHNPILKDVNIDFYFFVNDGSNRVLKINPSLLTDKSYIALRTEMMKLLKGVSDTKSLEVALNEKEIKKEEISEETTAKVVDKLVVDPTEEEIVTNKEQLVKIKDISASEEIIKNTVDKKMKAVTAVVNNIPEEPTPELDEIENDSISDATENDILREINSDKELLEKIYYQNKSNTVPKKSASSTARDALLLKEQQNITVGNMTVKELSKIKANDVPIPVNDISRSLTTTNENMKEIRYHNLQKAYIENVMQKDIVNAFLSLNDKSISIFVRNINVEDTSDELNYKDTYTVNFEDENRKRQTIKVDIPKFIDDRFLYLGGNKKLIRNQDYFFPIVKLGPDTVQVVSNYSKMTIKRKENKSTSAIERLKKLITSDETIQSKFIPGSGFADNKEYITTLEYDELSKLYNMFKVGNDTNIFFSQVEAEEYMKKNNISKKAGYMYIGKVKGNNKFINIDTAVTDKGEGVVDLILSVLPEEFNDSFNAIKAPRRLMYATVTLMKKEASVAMILGLWEGISEVIKKLGIEYEMVSSLPKDMAPGYDFIKFADCIIVYKANVYQSLVMSGFNVFNTALYEFADFDTKEPYIDYVKKIYGRAIIENALMNFYEFFIDSITLEILQTLGYPTDISNVIIHAVKLISDSQFKNDISQNLYRVRNAEIIPAILYEKIAKNYVQFRNANGTKKFSIPQDCVIKEILAQKTVEDYSTLNPSLEMTQLHSITPKGFRGVNLDDSYTLERRAYDPSMIGIISPQTSPDGNCGVSRTLSLEPKITNVRGFCEDNYADNTIDKLNDVNLFSPPELAIPLGTAIDDPTRLGHAVKQSNHVIPVKDSSPVLISNGFEEVARFHLTSNFAINAEDSGEIVDYDKKANIMIAKYKNGKCQAIDLNPRIVKNSGGGFFLTNQLVTDLKVGDKFKKNDVLGYHKDFFTNDKFNNCRMNMGTLAKVAITSSYNTYEDSTFITKQLSERCATEMCFKKSVVVGKNSNVFFMVKKGQTIEIGEPLISFDTSFEDDTINALLAKLGEEDKESILEGARNNIKSKYAGVIEDIKIYPTVDLEEMSPTLRNIVSSYNREISHKKNFLNKYDPTGKNTIVKCGILVDDIDHKIQPNNFGVIKGEHAEDGVLIEFYIKHSEPLEIGSKIANFTKHTW